MLQKRPHLPNVFHYGQRLFQEFLCLAWSSIESQRLQFIANHQADLRSELYSELLDGIHEDPNQLLGVKTILPPSFEGSYRDRMKRLADTTAIQNVIHKNFHFHSFCYMLQCFDRLTQNISLKTTMHFDLLSNCCIGAIFTVSI